VTEFITPGFNQGKKSACFFVSAAAEREKKLTADSLGKITQIDSYIISTIIVSPLRGSPTYLLSLTQASPGVTIATIPYAAAHGTGAFGSSLVD
jgi:hypothetical protein